MLLVALLLVVPAVFSYDSSFNYGCQNGLCTYQLVVPKEVAQYIDQQALSNEVAQITADLRTLNTTINNFNDTNTSDFTTKFNANYSTVSDSAQSVSTAVQAASQNATGLLSDSATANSTAYLLYNSIACFKAGTQYSSTCFTAPTTAAPATTTAVPSTAEPATDSGSTVSQGPVGSTVAGSSVVPVTGGSGTTVQPASDSTNAASPSTSAAPASQSADASSTTVESSPSTSPTSSTSG